ncbi:MAG: DUF1543 domain-containing protein [Prochlorococcus sp.]|jgi:hypothetical protein|tara:strand:+ start:2335 stop:2832 length:498 start_codon:yes stop_codon:yes gene_type:complete
MNLYLVVLGGRMPRGNVEMHDVRWVVGETIESTIPQLKDEWIGSARGLHVDSYKLIKFVGGHRITLVKSNEVNENEINKLWFINLGGYKAGEMLEQHHLELVVAPSANVAKRKARCQWREPLDQIHKDDHAAIIHLHEYSVLLEADPQGRDDGMQPDWSGYWIIN